jgi:cytochrome P450 family 6
MYPIIVNKGDTLVSTIERESANGRSIEAKNMMTRFTVDIISSIAFGMEANTLNNENEKLLKMLREIFGGGSFDTAKFFFMTSFPNFSKKLQLQLFSKDLSDFFIDVVGSNIKHREESNDNRKDFLNMLIQLKNKGSIDGEISKDVKKLTLNEVMAQAFLFFFAGSDTSSTAISFALAELSNNQEVQDKLRKEIEERTKETNGEITYELLFDMKYLDMVVNGEEIFY